jgi:hypothetical protein
MAPAREGLQLQGLPLGTIFLRQSAAITFACVVLAPMQIGGLSRYSGAKTLQGTHNTKQKLQNAFGPIASQLDPPIPSFLDVL